MKYGVKGVESYTEISQGVRPRVCLETSRRPPYDHLTGITRISRDIGPYHPKEVVGPTSLCPFRYDHLGDGSLKVGTTSSFFHVPGRIDHRSGVDVSKESGHDRLTTRPVPQRVTHYRQPDRNRCLPVGNLIGVSRSRSNYIRNPPFGRFSFLLLVLSSFFVEDERIVEYVCVTRIRLENFFRMTRPF